MASMNTWVEGPSDADLKLEAFNRELVTLAKEQRKKDDEEAEKKANEDRLAQMSTVARTYETARAKVADYLEENAGLGEKARNELTPFWVRFVGLLANCCFIAILVGFTYSGYASDQDTKYLSLDSAAQDNGHPTSDYRTCLTVPYAITKMYTLDTNGLWSGSDAYVPGRGLYIFDLNYFEKSAKTYKTFMLNVKAKIATVGAGASTRNLASNLGYLMSWTYKINDIPITTTTGQTDVVTFSGQPEYVFDKFYKSASLGSATQQCLQSPDITYNRATGVFLVQYSYSGYFASDSSTTKGCCKLQANAQSVSDGDCILPPPDYGYKSTYDSSHFNIRYNIHTLVTAWSVNQGISDYSLLDIVQTDLTKSAIGCYSLNSNCAGTTAGTTCTGSITVTASVAPTVGSAQITGLPLTAIVTSGGSWPPKQGMSVSGNGVPNGSTVGAVVSATALSFAVTTSTSTADAANPKLISVAAPAGVTQGMSVSGFCIAQGTTVATLVASTSFTLSANPTTSGLCTLYFGSTVVSYSVSLQGTTIGANPGTSFTFTASGFVSTGLLYDSVLSTCSITASGTKLYIEARMDGQWPGMDSIYCLVTSPGASTAKGCFVRIGNTFVLPYFNHVGTSGKPGGDFFNYKLSCACSAPSFSGTPQTFSVKTNTTTTSGSPQILKMDKASNYDYSALVGCTVSGAPSLAATATVTSVDTPTKTTVGNPPTTTTTYSNQLTISAPLTGTSPIPAGTSLTFTCPIANFYTPIYKDGTYGVSDGYCSMFDLVHGFTLLKGQYYDVVLYNWINSIIGLTTAIFTQTQINEMSTISAWAAIKFGGNAGAQGSNVMGTGGTTPASAAAGLLPNNGQLGTNAYSWCSPSGLNCAVYAMNTVDTFNQRINAVGAIAASSSCNSEFTMPDTAWVSANGLAGGAIVPPSNLFQDYYECYNTQVKSVLIAFGAGSGSAGSLTPLFVSIVVAVVLKFCMRATSDAIESAIDATESAREHENDAEKGGAHRAAGEASHHSGLKNDEGSGVEMASAASPNGRFQSREVQGAAPRSQMPPIQLA